jgi:hypothetical protein
VKYRRIAARRAPKKALVERLISVKLPETYGLPE